MTAERTVLGVSEEEFMRVSAAAEEANIRLEVIQGLPVWEFMPSPMHTIDAKRIDRSVRPEGEFHSFKDLSIRRPDIAVFCRLPEATRLSTTLVPEAVVELVSPGFYLAQGVKDMIVYVPETEAVEHFRRDGRAQHRSPVDIRLECGCLVTV